MPCKDWKHDWVAQLYGELGPDEHDKLAEHLERCAECRTTMAELTSSRQLLLRSAPAVPAVPRVVVLKPKSVWPTTWSFAAGAACAVAIFGLGLIAAPQFTSGPPPPQSDSFASMPATQPSPDRAQLVDGLRQDFLAFGQRLAHLEQRPAPEPSLTDSQLRQELKKMERRFDQARARDLEYLMRSMTDNEFRTGTWIDQTQDAINLLALRQAPWIREQ